MVRAKLLVVPLHISWRPQSTFTVTYQPQLPLYHVSGSPSIRVWAGLCDLPHFVTAAHHSLLVLTIHIVREKQATFFLKGYPRLFTAPKQVFYCRWHISNGSQLHCWERAVHSTIKIRSPSNESHKYNVPAKSQLAPKAQNIALFNWDVTELRSCWIVYAGYCKIWDLTGSKWTCEGIQQPLSGDFHHILSIIEYGSHAQIVRACVNTCPLCTQCPDLCLTEIIRLKILQIDSKDRDVGANALSFPHFL